MSGSMTKGWEALPSLTWRGTEGGWHVGHRLFWWVNMAKDGRWRWGSSPWPMSKWRCSVYCEEGSCQLCLLASQQDGETLNSPCPSKYAHRQADTSVQYISEHRKSRTSEWIILWPDPFGLRWSVYKSVCRARDGPPLLGPRGDWQAFYLRFRVSPWCKIPVAVHQRVTAFLTRSWTDHLYHCQSSHTSPNRAPKTPIMTAEQVARLSSLIQVRVNYILIPHCFIIFSFLCCANGFDVCFSLSLLDVIFIDIWEWKRGE